MRPVSAPRTAHRVATRALSGAMVLIGITMVALTIAGGGGILAKGVVIGVLFLAAGAGRLFVSLKGSL
jgi:hypothetical protein